MSLPSGATLTDAKCVGASIEYPFRDKGDAVTKVYIHKMQVKLTSYAPLLDNNNMTTVTQKPSGSPFPDDAAAYYVGDSLPSAIDGGMVEFERVFANIPADRNVANGKADPNGLYAFEFPETTSEIGDYTSTGGESFSHDASTHTSTMSLNLSTSDLTNLELNDQIEIRNNASSFFIKYDNSPPTGATITISLNSFSRCIITNKTSTSITCTFTWSSWYDLPVLDSGNDLNGVSATTYQVNKKISAGRNATLQTNSPSFIESNYIKSDDIYSINNTLLKKFVVFRFNGEVYPEMILSTTTSPTNLEYGQFIYNSVTIAAEDQVIERWRGNIYQLKLIKVIAQ
tara:strand:+ start:237 stop:1262 length:1026 start_codon:yes stop_codon:yes gene_type:complete